MALVNLVIRDGGVAQPGGAVTLRYGEVTSGVAKPSVFAGVGFPWRRRRARADQCVSRWGSIPRRGVLAGLPWGTPAPRADAMRAPWLGKRGAGAGVRLPWGAQDPQADSFALDWRVRTPRQDRFDLPWGDLAEHHAAAQRLPYTAPLARHLQRALPWGQATPRQAAFASLWRAYAAHGAFFALPWGPTGRYQQPIRIIWPVEPPESSGPITVPILPVYVMLPTLAAVRLPDRAPIRLIGISLQCDLDSWAWTFNATMAYADLPLVDPAGTASPPEIEVAINGYVWTFLVDGYDDNRRFGTRTLTLRGRSRSAELAQPYATARSFTQAAGKNAAQLADDELAGSGWTLLWDAVDWFVPGGTFGYQDLTPIDAIAQLANAIGAAVHTDPADKQLVVAPTYPESPWAWGEATPYAIIPASIVTAGDGSWEGGRNADGVWILSENAGTGALVKIAGTAGAAQLPMIVDRLVVHADAQRERGRSELASAGTKRRLTRTLPVFPSPPPAGQPDLGVVPPGKLLEFTEVDGETWRGQVMGIRIDAQRSGSVLSVRQHLTIERQYR